MAAEKTTPMLEQYLAIKGEYADSILFYRMGDFYEMFYEDAEVASKILEITLTSRNKNDKNPVPMCGVPAKAAKSYLAKLINQGYKVAICDQVEDSSEAKGLVKRDVVRVVTPGMLIEDELLDSGTNNYILAVCYHKKTAGIAYMDLSTGTFKVCESEENFTQVIDEVLRINPSEVLFPETLKNDPLSTRIIQSMPGISVSYIPDRAFEYAKAREWLLEQFQTFSLEGFGCERMKAGVSSAGAVLFYVRETQKQQVSHLANIEPYMLNQFLIVDDISCRNLELLQNIRFGSTQGTLLTVIDKTSTSMGGRLLSQEAKEKNDIRKTVREQLKSVYDLERLGSKISMGQSNARDLIALKRSIQSLPEIFLKISTLEASLFKWDKYPDKLYQLADLIEKAIREDAPPVINEGGMIKQGHHELLDELIRISTDGKGFLAQLEATEKSKTGINSLKVRYNKVFGYYIEIPKTHSQSVPDHYVRKQTLVNAERYITDELKTFENKVLGAEEQRASLEYEIFNSIRSEVARENKMIQQVSQFLAMLDCLMNLAEVAEQNTYHRPCINTEGIIGIEEGRHPVIEKMISGERFVPNSIDMDNNQSQVLVITGPNMAGKSTVLRQTALIVLMAHMGSFVPAQKADISITDRIFTRVGALDNLSQGQSTFMVEMEETANILNNATEKSLIILDEIGRGTSTFDGLSIAWAVAEYLHDLNHSGVKTLFATHYHELTDLVLTKQRVKNYNIAVKEWNDEIIFLRKFVEGGTNRSYGIQVARLAGIPEKVIKRAKVILKCVEDGENSLKGLAIREKQKEKKGPVQLDLFRSPDQEVISKIQRMDVNHLTPIEALNLLNEFKDKLKDQ
ncbi:MAG: DNA mismatch repair protein MutS [Desulfobacterales bacterium]|nr:DNA mismatch repair protein MutS [Desulfobacterales bacterium]